MGYTTREQWQAHYAEGRGLRQLGGETALLAEHVPPPDGGSRALDVGCGTGALAAYLAGLGYAVDALDFTESGLARARDAHPDVAVHWICGDIERGDTAELDEGGYDLVTMRLVYPFLHDRTRVLHSLAERLRPGGALVVITPTAEHTPADRRDIVLDEDAIGLLTEGWEEVRRLAADRLTVLVLRGHTRHGTRAVERQRPPAGPAATASLVVVTDAAGRVLLGRSRRGMWELPGGKTAGAESFEAAGVRELREETGLTASIADAYPVVMLADDSHGVPRLTAVIRVTAWSGTLTNREENLFERWEWHDPRGLACLGKVFTPAAQALDTVWPGVVPDLPPVHTYALAADRPPVPGEPAEAVRLRLAMAERVVAGGWAPSEAVRQALRGVPRHRFTPEQDLATAYDHDLAVVTRRDESGQAVSSVSAAWLQADMIESLRLRPGAVVYEAGSGGYNAELLAQVAGPAGRVVSGDIDPYVVRRTSAFTAEAGSRRVTPFEGDAALGAPAPLVPRGGFDGSMITYNVWDISPAWREQLAEGGRLVLPLEIGGYTRAIAFRRAGDVLHAEKFTHCGFVRAQGEHARTVPVVDLLGGELRLRFEHGEPAPTDGLEEALRGPRHEVATGVTMGSGFYFGSLQLYAATTLPGFCRLSAHREKGTGVTLIAKDRDAPALLGDASLACLVHVQIRDGDSPDGKEWEWVVHAFGAQGPQLAEELAATVRAWDREVRGGDDPELTVYPAGTPDDLLPGGEVLDRPLSRLVFRWPGRDVLRQAPVELGGTLTAAVEGT